MFPEVKAKGNIEGPRENGRLGTLWANGPLALSGDRT